MSAEPVPAGTPLVELLLDAQGRPTGKTTGIATRQWLRFFEGQGVASDAAASRVGRTTIPPLAGALGATDVMGGVSAPGLYRVNYYVRITRAAGLNSQLTVVFAWTDGGVACSRSGPLLNANTVNTHDEATFPIRRDQGSPVTVTTIYVSAGAPTMAYSLEVDVEALP